MDWPAGQAPLTLIHLAEIDSTQAFLKRHPELGFCGLVADHQSEGRGRQGNAWISAPGQGLWMSAAVPAPDLQPGMVLQQAMLAVIAALGEMGAELGLKWPNDLVARKAGRLLKLGGIIGEKAGDRLILGLGLNVHCAPLIQDRAIPAGCLSDLREAPPEILDLARKILDAWTDFGSPLAESSKGFRWPEPGTPIRWEQGQGVVMEWVEDGRLKVTTASGIERLSAAEIQGLSPY